MFGMLTNKKDTNGKQPCFQKIVEQYSGDDLDYIESEISNKTQVFKEQFLDTGGSESPRVLGSLLAISMLFQNKQVYFRFGAQEFEAPKLAESFLYCGKYRFASLRLKRLVWHKKYDSKFFVSDLEDLAFLFHLAYCLNDSEVYKWAAENLKFHLANDYKDKKVKDKAFLEFTEYFINLINDESSGSQVDFEFYTPLIQALNSDEQTASHIEKYLSERSTMAYNVLIKNKPMSDERFFCSPHEAMFPMETLSVLKYLELKRGKDESFDFNELKNLTNLSFTSLKIEDEFYDEVIENLTTLEESSFS